MVNFGASALWPPRLGNLYRDADREVRKITLILFMPSLYMFCSTL
jgi:hypothetical protein